MAVWSILVYVAAIWYFIVIWYILPVLVRCAKKNLATLTSTNLSVLAILNRFSNLVKEESALKHFVEAIICKQGLPDGLFHTNPQFLVHFEWKFSTSFMNFWYLYFVDIYFILWQLCIYCGHLLNVGIILILVFCIKKNLAAQHSKTTRHSLTLLVYVCM
jgi:hypothetical protein